MKPVLILGLGNPLMGDDGAGARIAELLAADGETTGRADVAVAGTDLLRSMDRLEGRSHVILIDAVETPAGQGGGVLVREPPLAECMTQFAHTLSAPGALALLRCLTPSLAATRFTWVLVEVAAVRAGPELSPQVAAALPRAAAAVKELL